MENLALDLAGTLDLMLYRFASSPRRAHEASAWPPLTES